MNIQEITITKVTTKESNRIDWNVDLDGKPFGQIWHYSAFGERLPYHVQTLAGFYGETHSYKTAEQPIRGLM